MTAPTPNTPGWTEGDLLPCPFCGSDEVEDIAQRFVRCLVCYAEGPVSPRIAEAPTAVKLWNTRSSAASPALYAALEALDGAWLPNVLCPTDGKWRVHKLPDGREVVAMFDGYSVGKFASRWRMKEFAYHNPSRPTGEFFGGVERFTGAYDTWVVTDLPEGVYPTHFRPNDTVHGDADAFLARQAALTPSEQEHG